MKTPGLTSGPFPFKNVCGLEGKHNDLDNVGYTSRHHTFFEMLGNFSFGDYFKEEAIQFGWEFLTEIVALPADRLWVTVFREDDEAYDLWHQQIGVPQSRIVRLGEKDNFWQMGDTGPCGPCSEILIDQGEALSCGQPTCGVGCECDRYLEIWNLVFMQYDRDASGMMHLLPKPSIDTGMGLERLAAVAQGGTSNYDSDLFQPILQEIGEQTGHRYGSGQSSDRAMRVIADHLRAIAFLIADGILPSNEGRGYVLRRILRRASRFGRVLGVSRPFLSDLLDVVVRQMETVYPELQQATSVISEIVQGEEERFIGTLDQGLPLLETLVKDTKAAGKTSLPGESVFKLYDTYGFPLDLVEEAAQEEGLSLDREGYDHALQDQRDRARKSATFSVATTKPYIAELNTISPPTQFLGYAQCEAEGMVQALLKGERIINEAVQGDEIEVILDRTPFYPEGGGQVGDHGILVGPACRIQIQDTKKVGTGIFVHAGVILEGQIKVGDQVYATVNRANRQDAARNHTATHLVHAALRELLGPHVKQYGSLVAPNRLRFDFAHFKQMTSRDIESIEALVNEQIQIDTAVQTQEMSMHEAVNRGALAFFGDKYGDQVRVVEIGAFSKELCGGTHCMHTGEVGEFRIVSEGGVAAGVRRIEALTGMRSLAHAQQADANLRELSELLKTTPDEVVSKTKKLLSLMKENERELERQKILLLEQGQGNAVVQTRDIHGVTIQVQRTDGLSMQELRALSDKVRNNLSSGVLILGSVKEEKVSLLVIVTKDLSSRLKAGELAKFMAGEVGGSGGGRPEMAQAGGNNPKNLDAAFEKAFDFIEQRMKAP